VGIGTTAPLGQLHVTGNNDVLFTQNGNVGIGTTDPARKFTVSSSGNTPILLESTGASGRKYSLWSNRDGNFNLFDETVDVARVVINSNGTVGIGTTNPQSVLTVTSNIGIIGRASDGTSALNFRNNADSANTGALSSDTNEMRLFHGGYTSVYTGSAENVRITSAGNVGIGTTNPGRELEISGMVKSSGFITNQSQLFVSGSGTQNLSLADLGINVQGGYSAGFGILTISWKNISADRMNTYSGMVTYQYPDSGFGSQSKLLYIDEIASRGDDWITKPEAVTTNIRWDCGSTNGWRWSFTQLGS